VAGGSRRRTGSQPREVFYEPCKPALLAYAYLSSGGLWLREARVVVVVAP
jgi:hypothetical protein